ncbi:MAG: tetraacyldisaccharide 4'-kinase [Candidatus Binatales bacterium]
MLGRSLVRKRPFLERLWREELRWYELPLWIPTVPAAALYACALAMRSGGWRLMRKRPALPTISVGNLIVGGSGKTPFTLFLAQKLAERGVSVGIVSRGYRGRRKGRAALVSDGAGLLLTPEQAGDEPVMMARQFDGPIAVARRRIHGVELLQRSAKLDAVVLDDAFQHIRLKRDFDLLLVNTERGLGNGWLLPAGPMRERIGAARRADAIVLIGRDRAADSLTPAQRARLDRLKRPDLFHATIRPRCLVHAEMGRWRETPLAIVGRRVLAVSGLAEAGGFYEMLREHDAELVGVLEYPDHHKYTAADWQAISDAARDAEMVITTEKDLVKLERFPFLRDSLYALRLEVAMDEKAAAQLLDMIVAAIVFGGGYTPRRVVPA